MNDTSWEFYSGHREEQHDAGLRLLSLWENDWEDGDIVLDIGCGTGELTKIIAERDNVKCVTGIDISAKAIEFAKQNNLIDGKIRYLVGDATILRDTLSHLEKAFTKVYCNAVLHWNENKEKVLQNVFWCLRENGSFVFNILRGEKLHLYDIYYGSIKMPKWMEYLQDFQPTFYPLFRSSEDFDALISRSGFKKYPRTLKDEMVIYSLDTKEKYKDYMVPLLKHLEFIPTELHDDFLTDCFSMFLRDAHTVDGVPTLSLGIAVFKLQK
ncbi:malonyl-[acyl-carrier protein] O-methyltransferase-like [Ptychodera flava]|uniref:malonyl-[acyl-carrier protein] O-methyltransferase-like n=1 Tax=Ptychodera flava TaxID=63121 RepID=UPI00396A38F0